MEIAVDAVLLLLVSLVGLQDVGIAGILGYSKVALSSVVVPGLLNKLSLELLLVDLLALETYFNEHLNTLGDVDALNHLSIALLLNLTEDLIDEALLDGLVLDNVRLKLVGLHGLHAH